LLEGLDVEINGKMTPLGRLGQVGIKDKNTLSILLFDPEVA
jgi:ribosome recycling factor